MAFAGKSLQHRFLALLLSVCLSFTTITAVQAHPFAKVETSPGAVRFAAPDTSGSVVFDISRKRSGEGLNVLPESALPPGLPSVSGLARHSYPRHELTVVVPQNPARAAIAIRAPPLHASN